MRAQRSDLIFGLVGLVHRIFSFEKEIGHQSEADHTDISN